MKVIRIIALICLLLLIIPSPITRADEAARANDKVELRLRLKEGQEFNYVSIIDQKISQNVSAIPSPRRMGSDIRMAFALRVQVLDVQPDDTCVLRLTYRRAAMEMKGLSRPEFRYDSLRLPKKLHPATAGVSALVGQSLDVTLTPLGKVLKVEGTEKIIDRMMEQLELPAQMKQDFRKQFEKSLSSQSMQAMGGSSLPTEPVGVGSTWSSESAAVQSIPIMISATYTLLSTNNDTAIIGIRSNLRPNPEFDSTIGGTSTKSQFSGTQNGTMLLDEQTGLSKSVQLQQRISGAIVIAHRGKETLKIRMYIKSSIRAWMLPVADNDAS